MPERTLYYWGKMYTQQLAEGESFADLKKCITINIMDYNFPLVNKVHSVYHVVEDENGSCLTDVLEIHFLDLEKLRSGQDIEGLKEVAANALQKGMDIALIASITGLSEEEIKTLAK
ncbi:MAG: PD-(D/E)XK nuclease family transposase [Anaerovoracaceae bacterium]|jgi:hypothetical protein